MLLGSARVATRDQNLDVQRDAPTAAITEQIFADMVSGTAQGRNSDRWASRQCLRLPVGCPFLKGICPCQNRMGGQPMSEARPG
jgi:hypothetical protein